MDPVTASILIGTAAVSTYMAIRQQNKAIEAGNRQRQDQEKARIEATREELATAQQSQNTALGSAAGKSSGSQPSFAASSMLGNLSSVSNTSSAGSSGTF